MSRNKRRRAGKKRSESDAQGENNGAAGTLGVQQANRAQKPPKMKKNENGIFDFSEKELAEDTAIRLISDTSRGDVKYSSFEEYLKDH